MKRIGFFAAALVLLVLPACASNGGSRSSVAGHQVIDQEKMNRIDEISLGRGVKTTWINPPTRRIPAHDGIGD
jgi:hypothetical protein